MQLWNTSSLYLSMVLYPGCYLISMRSESRKLEFSVIAIPKSVSVPPLPLTEPIKRHTSPNCISIWIEKCLWWGFWWDAYFNRDRWLSEPTPGTAHISPALISHGNYSNLSQSIMTSTPPLKGLKVVELGGLAPVPFVGYSIPLTFLNIASSSRTLERTSSASIDQIPCSVPKITSPAENPL